MKLKKFLISLLIILTSSAGLLFGCGTKDLKLQIQFGEDVVSSIELKMPKDSIILGGDNSEEGGEEGEEQTPENDGENSDEETIVDESKALIKVVAENANAIFDKGLDVSFSESNVVKAVLKQKEEDGYFYY